MGDDSREILVPGPARGIAALLDRDGSHLVAGAMLPALWHWAYFLERPRHSELGVEGHAVNGVPQPPAPGLRRMFAGGRVTTHHQLRLGVEATSEIEVVASRTRHGRSGAMTIVTTARTIVQDGEVAVIDEQDIVYREPTPITSVSPPLPDELPEDIRAVMVDEATLFQFSALTYNAHRIHYDLAYCRTEDYPALVVHGPLQAMLMADAAYGQSSGVPGTRFSYRLLAPLLLGQGLGVSANANGAGIVAAVFDSIGRKTAEGSVADLGERRA